MGSRRVHLTLGGSLLLVLFGLASVNVVFILFREYRRGSAEAVEEARHYVKHEIMRLHWTLRDWGTRRDHTAAQRELSYLSSRPQISFVAVWGPDGVITGASRLGWVGEPHEQCLPEAAALAAKTYTENDDRGFIELAETEESLYGLSRLSIYDVASTGLRPTETPSVLMLAYDLRRPIQAARAEVEEDLAGFATFVLVAFCLVGGFMYWFVTRRTKSLLRATTRVASGDLSARTGMRQGDELASLGHAFDAMAEALQSAHTQAARLALAVENVAESIIITDPDGRITYVNQAFERITGYRKSEVLGENPRILKSGTVDSSFYNSLWSTITAGEVWKGTFQNIRKDATPLEEESTISPILLSTGEVSGYVAVKRDVTEERRRDKIRIESQKMKALGTLAGGVAHDFNNILSAIMGHAELARMGLPEGQQARADVEEILEASVRARDLIQQITNFGTKRNERRVTLDVKAEVENTLHLLRCTFPKTITLVSRIDEDVGYLRGEATALHQILMNLCSNAAQAMSGEAGTVQVLACREETHGGPDSESCPRAGPVVKLHVIDCGTGMSRAVQERIFEPYFTTKEIGKGAGLGLSIVHAAVTRLGGSVEVDSTPGRGTRFTALLPALQGQPATSEVPQDGIPAGTGHVLLVEDEPMLRHATARMLEVLGYEVTVAANGQDALERFAETPDGFDAVVTDHNMPAMSGMDLARKLSDRFPRVPILLYTGLGMEFSPEALRANGISALVQKPLVSQDLGRALVEIMGHRQNEPTTP